MEIADFEIYPNPASGNALNVIINDPDQVKNIMLINESGQIVKAEQLTIKNNSDDISDLPNGLYIVKIAYKNNSYKDEKLIVK